MLIDLPLEVRRQSNSMPATLMGRSQMIYVIDGYVKNLSKKISQILMKQKISSSTSRTLGLGVLIDGERAVLLSLMLTYGRAMTEIIWLRPIRVAGIEFDWRLTSNSRSMSISKPSATLLGSSNAIYAGAESIQMIRAD